jgi:hypothetical protein
MYIFVIVEYLLSIDILIVLYVYVWPEDYECNYPRVFFSFSSRPISRQ